MDSEAGSGVDCCSIVDGNCCCSDEKLMKKVGKTRTVYRCSQGNCHHPCCALLLLQTQAVVVVAAADDEGLGVGNDC